MKMFRNGFWQKLVIILAILIELGLLLWLLSALANGALAGQYALVFFLVLWFISAALGVFIVNSSAEEEYKIAWLFFALAMPLIGPVFYLLFAHKIRTKRQKKALDNYYATLRKDIPNKETCEKLLAYSQDCDRVSHYVTEASDACIYENSSVQYFSLGDEALPVMIRELKEAHHYIFLEFFIITPGKMWNSILEVLKQKTKEGLDVRVVYDDVGNLGSTPIGYDKELQKYGIKAHIFRPIKPVLDIRMNNRDHRKIMDIDGHTVFTGGINLADEYVNAIEKHGHWKDNAIMVKGKAAYGYTLLFIANYAASFGWGSPIDYDYYRPETFIDEDGGFPRSDGFVEPYGDVPYDDEEVGEGVYLSILGRAHHYVYISTPYLILDEKMASALARAAMEGVDVRLLTPGVPDKKLVFMLTRANYGSLLRAGVKIYEYTPGFVHQKMFVSDDKLATIGTINLDYRSLYLHYENGTLLIGNSSIAAMKQDFLDTICVSDEVTYSAWKQMRKKKWLIWALLRLVAPLL